MMSVIGAFEAKTHFAHLLERVAQGEQVTITKHGTPVARLVPVHGTNPKTAKEAIRKLKEFRQGQTLGRVSIRQLIDEGRR
ncbi:MAG: type II toxin-antitoxin system Phd/YefM family antitoxin [Nitrospirales bacterium]